jgi:DNA-binding IclR family transcriptional regulator
MASEGVKNNQSIGKALAILEAMVDDNKPMRLLDISKKLDIPSSTVLRFLNSLINAGYVRQEEDSSRYYLTLKLASLGRRVYGRFSYQSILKPYLYRISNSLQESVSLSIEQDMNVVYIDAVDGPDHVLQTLQRIGKIAPMHSTGAGKVLLLNASDDDLDRFVHIKGLPGFTANTLTTKVAFLKAMNLVRERGYAYDDEECELGVRCIAVPVRDFTGKVVASISVSAPISRMGEEREKDILEVLLKVSHEASQELGYQEGNPIS